jgi:hypothetical protein
MQLSLTDWRLLRRYCIPTPPPPPAILRVHLWQTGWPAQSLHAQTDFDVILAERSVVPNLNALDTLISEAIARRAATAGSAQPAIAPHQLPPAALLTARLAPQLAHEQSQLNARLQTLQGQNARLADAMATQRAEMEALLAGAASAADDLQNAIDALAVDTSVASLLADSGAADREMVTMMGDWMTDWPARWIMRHADRGFDTGLGRVCEERGEFVDSPSLPGTNEPS